MNILSELISNQLYVFLIYSFSGVIIGLFFDVFRILRKSFKTPDFITYIEDIIFWILTGLFLIYIIFKFNNGEIRSYIFIGLGIGILLYLLIFSKYFIKINVIIIKYLKAIFRTIFQIITYPFKVILKIFDKLILKNIIKIKNVIIFYVKKCKKDKNFQKNKKEKKDFRKKCRK